MIRPVLISGALDDERLFRVLGELADLAPPSTADREDREVVLVIESDGGNCRSLRNFLECALDDDRTRTTLGNATVKIYNAQSAAAVIALFVGRYREMLAETTIGLHLPLLTVDFCDVDMDNRLIGRSSEECRKTLQVVDEVMRRFGLDEPKLRSELHQSGWLRLPAAECLKRRIVTRLFGLRPSEPGLDDCDQAPARDERAARTILISGTLTERRLALVMDELRTIAARTAALDDDVVLILESDGGELFSTMAFMDEVAQDGLLRRLVERAQVKVYEACGPSALLAFSWGAWRELAKRTKVKFSLGQLTVQMGDPSQLTADGQVSAQLSGDWKRYQSVVGQLMDRLGLNHDPQLCAELYASGRLTLTAEDCLRRGLVSRLF